MRPELIPASRTTITKQIKENADLSNTLTSCDVTFFGMRYAPKIGVKHHNSSPPRCILAISMPFNVVEVVISSLEVELRLG